jgi:hypothetical protein
MKFTSFRNGQLGLVLTLSVLVSGCNPEEYFPVEEFVQGGDAYCSQAQDLNACHDLGDRCQGAFLDLEKDDQEPIFAACIANPNWVDPSAPVDPAAPVDPTDPADPTEPTDPAVPVEPTEPTDPAVPVEPTDPTDPAAPVDPSEGTPTLEDAIKSKCADLDAKYLYVKKLVSKKETKVVKKVKVCHSTDKTEHTIIVACPALKAHSKHHDGNDYLGACK